MNISNERIIYMYLTGYRTGCDFTIQEYLYAVKEIKENQSIRERIKDLVIWVTK